MKTEVLDPSPKTYSLDIRCATCDIVMRYSEMTWQEYAEYSKHAKLGRCQQCQQKLLDAKDI